MKKFLSVILALMMVFSSGVVLTSCSSSKEEEKTSSQKKKKKKDKDDDDDDETESKGFLSQSIPDDGSDSSSVPTVTVNSDLSKDPTGPDTSTSMLDGPVVEIGPHEIPAYSYTQVTLEPQEIWNQEGLVITVTGYKLGAGNQREFLLTVVNGTGHKVKLDSEMMAINGVQQTDWYIEEIEDGQTIESSFFYFLSLGDELGIWDPGMVQTILTVYYDDGASSYRTPILTFYTSVYDPNFAVDVSYGVELYNDGQVRFTAYHYVAPSRYDDGYLYIFIENYSDKELSIWAENVVINGIEGDFYLSSYVMPGYKAVGSVRLSKTKLEEIGVDKIENIGLIIRFNPSDDYSTKYYTNPVTISV
ncbi:MAG: hypothetical protein J6Y08_02695 [Clostridiales bacterium]|nr:hypothetical protein [Clostridiales bacterium]